MYIAVNEIPKERWMNEKALKLVDNFNAVAKENKMARLVLMTHDDPSSREELESILEEGMYDFFFSCMKTNPYTEELKSMIDEAENRARFLYFELSNLDIQVLTCTLNQCAVKRVVTCIAYALTTLKW